MLKRYLLAGLLVISAGYTAFGRQTVPERHIIIKGDTWYSLSKRYHVTYDVLRQENKHLSDKLRVGDTLLIPQSPDVNPEVTSKEAEPAKAMPVAKKMHTVKPGETLSAIARKYGTTVMELKKLNKLSSTTLHAGQKLLVGTKPDAPAAVAVVRQDSSSSSRAPEKVVPVPAFHDTVLSSRAKRDSLPVTVSHAAEQNLINPVESFAKGRKEVVEEGAVVWIEDEAINPGKYFALHRSAPIGTIIKLTNRMNHRVVFVKVVGKLPETGENEGIILKISKAAADKLGVMDARFQAQLNYGVEAP